MFWRRISPHSAEVLFFSLLPAIYTADAAISEWMTNFAACSKTTPSMIRNLSSPCHYGHILAAEGRTRNL